MDAYRFCDLLKRFLSLRSDFNALIMIKECIMDTNAKKMTREDAVRRFMAAKQKKQECVKKMKIELASLYEQRTGKKIDQIFVL